MSGSPGARRNPYALAALAVAATLAVALVLLALRPTLPSAAPTRSPTRAGPATPRTAPPGSELFVGAGDIGDCGSEGDSQTAAILDALPAAQVFTLGDNAYDDGTREQFERCYEPTWGRHRDRTWPSPGNHEYRTSGAAGYFDYFGGRAGPDRRGWYAFDLGAWRVYSLNSNCEPIGGCGRDSAQVAWLAADLAAYPKRCTLAFMHHPRFSSGAHGSDTSLELIWNTLYEAGVELVLAGHEHSYERFEPMNREGALDRAAGITLFVAGTGGRSLRGFDDPLATSAARGEAWGVLELTLSPDRWSSRFLAVEGASFTDEAEGTCHDPARFGRTALSARAGPATRRALGARRPPPIAPHRETPGRASPAANPAART
ncbi:MAG TPA: metallophosphoesterase [Candidatus Binatia bacterium]|nr:metallophosphoesterase [Candidatus Binatia bacterium]